MDVLELFAGGGGAALGLERAGMSHRALCEWDASACATLREAGFETVVEGDVRDLPSIEWVSGSAIDLLWSSWPCQPWSGMGQQKGSEDDRDGWPWTLEAIDWFEPRWFVGENVTGLLCYSGQEPRTTSSCRRTYFERVVLAQLRERYDHVGWFVLNAADFGVPQHRRRVFVWAGPAPVIPPEATHCSPRDLSQVGLFGANRRPWATFDWWHEPTPTVCANEHKGHTRPDVDRGRHGALSRLSDAWYLSTGKSVVPLEVAAAAQGFPDDHPWQGTRVEKYRQVGNAVPPMLAEVVGRAVLQADTRWREAIK